MDHSVYARFYVFPGQTTPDRITIPADYLDQTTFHWPTTPDDAAVFQFGQPETRVDTDAAQIIKDYEVDFKTIALSVVRKRLVLEDIGPVWHVWLAASPVEEPSQIDTFRKTPGAILFGILGVIALTYLVGFFIPYLLAPFETMGKIIYHLKAITSIVMVGFSIIAGVWLMWKNRFLLAGCAVLSFVPATFVFFSFYGVLLQPDGIPGQDGYTYRQYLFDFVGLQSYGLQFLAPVMPLLTFVLQAVGLKFVGDLLKTTVGLTSEGGTMEKFVLTTQQTVSKTNNIQTFGAAADAPGAVEMTDEDQAEQVIGIKRVD